MSAMSSSDRTRLLKAQLLARFFKNNPTIPDMANKGQSAEIKLLREVGTTNDCGVCCEPVCNIDLSGAYIYPLSNNPSNSPFYYVIAQAELDAAGFNITIPTPPIGFPTDDSNYGLFVFAPTVCNATSYSTRFTDEDGVISGNTSNLGTVDTPENSPFSQTMFFAFWPTRVWDSGSAVFEITASNACSSSTTDAVFGCFLEGAPVTMADGSLKPIENVSVGEQVIGAFGEINTVIALHRPPLGAGRVCVINNEHTTTTHHPHVSPDRKFYSADPTILSGLTYGKKHIVILANGETERRIMPGLKKERILKLETGVSLQTVTGPRTVNTIDYKPMSPMTQVYHLVVSGSHTFNVEGYAVTGWAREDDFNYDTWSPT